MQEASLRMCEPEIPAYAYTGRTDIRSLTLADPVEAVGEGAFFRCTNLTEIHVGRGLRRIGAQAFSQIGPYADIVWLCRIPYRSMLTRILPPFEQIMGICAPGMPFSGRPQAEKTVLAIGMILHPEWEAAYSTSLMNEYLEYIHTVLLSDPAALTGKNCIVRVIRSLSERRSLFKLPETSFLRLLSYARSLQTDVETKQLLDRLEREITGNSISGKRGEEEKKLIRKIYTLSPEKEMRALLEGAGIDSFPDVFYAARPAKDGTACTGDPDEGKKESAPPEILKLIESRYIGQYSSALREQSFRPDPVADGYAELLDRDSLRGALAVSAGIVPGDGESGRLEEEAIRCPLRLIPLLRYADRDCLRLILLIRKQILDTGKEAAGFDAVRIIGKAALLSEDPEAAVFAGMTGQLREYAAMHGKNEKTLFFDLFRYLEESGREELPVFAEQYGDMVYDCFLEGTGISGRTFSKERLQSPAIRRVLEGYVFFSEETGFFSLSEGAPADAEGMPVQIGDTARIVPAAPHMMRAEEISAWQKRTGREDQLYETERWIHPGSYEKWKSRYRNLRVSYDELRELAGKRMKLDGTPDSGIRISFCGKRILTAERVRGSEKASSLKLTEGTAFVLGDLEKAAWSERELREMLHRLDEAFWYHLLLAGRIPAGPYLRRLSLEEMQTVLEASLIHGHHENAAILLASIRRIREGEDGGDLSDSETGGFGVRDDELLW